MNKKYKVKKIKQRSSSKITFSLLFGRMSLGIDMRKLKFILSLKLNNRLFNISYLKYLSIKKKYFYDVWMLFF